MSETRRSFLSTAAGVALAGPGSGAAEAALPTVRLGEHDLSRLILGSNPFSGGSHFNPILNQHMKEWNTPERVLELLKRSEGAGIRTWQLHIDPKLLDCLKQYRADGGKMNCFILSDTRDPEASIASVLKHSPIGIAHHGEHSDVLFRTNKMESIGDFVKEVRDSGVLAGVSKHNPAVIDYVESKGWPVDFFMACVYRRSRTAEEVRAEFNEATVGEPYFEKDPERMCKVIRQTKKTCFAFKILAAGRAIRSAQTVEAAFRFVFENIKPQDCVIVGMYPRFQDEITLNAGLTRKLGKLPLG